MTTPTATHRTGAPKPRRRAGVLVALALVVALVLPLGYLFDRAWTASGNATDFVATERDGIEYADKLSALLARLATAQVDAVRGKSVNATAVRDAVQAVDELDRDGTDPLGIRERWGPLPGQIETALKHKGKGQPAQRAYAGPIGLTHGLLREIGDTARVLKDPELDGYHLADTALLRIPDVLLDTAHVGALAHGASAAPNSRVSGRNPQIAVVQDRVARSAETISLGLRAGSEATGSDSLGAAVLKPLDEFVAAVDGLVKASTGLSTNSTTAKAEVDTATGEVSATALALGAAVLDEFDDLLERRADDIASQRRGAALALVIGLLALAAMPILLLRSRATRRVRSGPPPPADVVDARDLIRQEPVLAGAAPAAPRRSQG